MSQPHKPQETQTIGYNCSSWASAVTSGWDAEGQSPLQLQEQREGSTWQAGGKEGRCPSGQAMEKPLSQAVQPSGTPRAVRRTTGSCKSQLPILLVLVINSGLNRQQVWPSLQAPLRTAEDGEWVTEEGRATGLPWQPAGQASLTQLAPAQMGLQERVQADEFCISRLSKHEK